MQQVAELVVAVGGGRATVGLAVQFAVGGVGVAVAAPSQQAVLCVIRAAVAVKSANPLRLDNSRLKIHQDY